MASIIDKIPAILVMEICKQVLVWLESYIFWKWQGTHHGVYDKAI
jgi:hypothetical protein